MRTTVSRAVVVSVVVGLLAAAGVLLALVFPLQASGESETADTTPPRFQSAQISSDGGTLTITFSEPLTVPALIRQLIDAYNMDIGIFLRAMLTVTVDGHTNHAVTSSLSGDTGTLRLETPHVGSGQTVTVAFNNPFAVSGRGLFVDEAGNVLENFGPQTVTNNATAPAAELGEMPVVSTLHLALDEGQSGSYTVKLPSQPDTDTTVSVIAYPSFAIEASPASLTFTPENWDTPQTVTVTAHQDDDDIDAWAITANDMTATVAHGIPDSFIPELEEVTAAGPDVLVAVSYSEAEVYLREALQEGFADTFLFVDGTRIPQGFARVGWDLLEGSYGTGPGVDATRPETRAFVDAYTAAYGEEPPRQFMNETYDAAVLIGLAASAAGTVTDSAAIRDQLRAVANPPGVVVGPGAAGINHALRLIAEGVDVNYEGASGPVDLDDNGDVLAGFIEVWRIEDGQITPVRHVPVQLDQ